ncbi:MAG: phage terminase large subunit, partial [Paraclostridium sp.]
MNKKMALSKAEAKKMAEIKSDPIKWAQVFLRTFDTKSKKIVPWVGRWYQVEMMRDTSVRKVYRCGRRIGKTETMVVEMLYQAFNNKNFRVLMAAPYENQIRNMFTRLNELLAESPLVKSEVIAATKNPYKIEFANGSMILGFTTGDDASSIRGQRADWIYIDEIDFMSEYCFEVVAAVAIERPDIGITVSSTPLGKRSHFYKMCTDPKMGYSQHFHPSTHNPNWDSKMEAELRAQLTAEGYVHEVLAEFGTQEKGVFDKDALDRASEEVNYAYNELDFFQKKQIAEGEKEQPIMHMYSKHTKAPNNVFRTMGVDWDKYGANSSLLIL